MGNKQRSIQTKQLSQIELPFQLKSIPKKILQTNDYQRDLSTYLFTNFKYTQSVQNYVKKVNVPLEELLQEITIRKRYNYFQDLLIRNDEDYYDDINPQTSIQTDLQALILLLYFMSKNNQVSCLNIRWISPLSFQDFNEVMNLIASFKSLKSLVLNLPCNQINNPDDHVFLRSFSNRIFSQNNLTSLDLALNFEEYTINSLEFNDLLKDLSNQRFLQIITLKILSRVYPCIVIDSMIVLSIHPSLKSISIQTNNLISDDNTEAFQNKNISETFLNQLKSSLLQSVCLNQFNTCDLNILFAILTRLPLLKDFSLSSDCSTSINQLRLPIIPYKRNSTFPVLESIEVTIFQRLNAQFAQEIINGLSQFKTYQVSCLIQIIQGVKYSDLRLEKALIAMSQGEITNYVQMQSNVENNLYDPLGTKYYDLLKEYIFFKKSVYLSICAFKKILWSYMMNNPLYIILELYMD